MFINICHKIHYMLTVIDIISRFIAAALIGAILGIARKDKPAGARTFALICLGSAIFTSVSINGAFGTYDASRIVAQIVSGIGFLGVGVIWKTGINKPSGLTTAAAIWVCASIGVLVGMGIWLEVIVGAILTVAILLSKNLEKKKKQKKLA